MPNIVAVSVFLVAIILSGCRGCIAQHDPRADWARFKEESTQANKEQPKLTEDGKIPAAAGSENAAPVDPVEQKYAQICASCHGPQGKGDGAAATALNPKPRNFTAWKDNVTDEYIAKVITEGGAAVGKSASMAAWGGVLSKEEIKGLVAKINKFRGK